MGAEGAGGPDGTEPVDRRAETFTVVEAAHWRKEGSFTEAVLAYGRACYEFGRTGGDWPEEKKPVEAPAPAVEAPAQTITFTVTEEAMELKGKFFLVHRADKSHRDAANIVAFSPRRSDAEWIAKALHATPRPQ